MTWMAVAIGGALGSAARHGVNVLMGRLVHRPVPYATAAVNLLGCLAIGTLAGLLASNRLQMSQTLRAFVFVGVLGGFTTFSSFGLDTFTLGREGSASLAFWNVAAQVGLGLLAVAAGFRAGSA
jgi:fluoride exporter